MQGTNSNMSIIAVLMAALLAVGYCPSPSSAFTFVHRTTTTTTTAKALLGQRQQQLVPRSSTVMSNDASETITVSDDGDEQQVVVAADAAADGAGEKKEMKESDHAVYVGNLAFTMTPDDVRALISEKVGSDVTIESVSMPTNSQNINEETGQPLSKGFCFVKVGSEEQVTKVVDAMNGIEVDGRAVRVNMIKPKDEVAAERAAKKKTSRDVPPGKKKLYIGNLSFDATAEDIKEEFAKYGNVDDVYLPMKDGRPRGFGFVTMGDEDADRATEGLNGKEFFERTLVVNEPLKEGESPVRRPRKTVNKNQFKMYIGNLSFYTSKETLQEIFQEFGEVYDCYLPVDPQTDRPRGFGFITMDREAGERAIAELDGMEVDDRVIRVNEAQGKRRTPPEMFGQDNSFGNSNNDDGDEF